MTTPTSQTTVASSEQSAPSEDSLICLNCGEPLELACTGRCNVLVTKLSGDEGGTYDQCEATSFDLAQGTYGPYKRQK
jgi:precorrin-6x reductase